MKAYTKVITLSLVTALSTGGGFLLAQQPPVVKRPSYTPQVATPKPNTAGTATHRGATTEQPLVRAYLSLQEAKRALQDAAADKGGLRDKAIQDVDQAIKDVGAAAEATGVHSTTDTTRGGGRGVTPGPSNTSFSK